MPMYPAPLERRFAAVLEAIQVRLRKLESRTASIDSGFPMAALPGVVDSAYNSTTGGDPKVYVNGSSQLTGPYKMLGSYAPAANDNVVLIPVSGSSQSYVVLGNIW